jgi:hypothetical protein
MEQVRLEEFDNLAAGEVAEQILCGFVRWKVWPREFR